MKMNENEWKLMKMNENEWKWMKIKVSSCCPGLLTWNFHFYTFSLFIHYCSDGNEWKECMNNEMYNNVWKENECFKIAAQASKQQQ